MQKEGEIVEEIIASTEIRYVIKIATGKAKLLFFFFKKTVFT